MDEPQLSDEALEARLRERAALNGAELIVEDRGDGWDASLRGWPNRDIAIFSATTRRAALEGLLISAATPDTDARLHS
jgi:hypothetical protein